MDDKKMHNTTLKLLAKIMTVAKKFNEVEKISIDLGNGEKLYPSELHVLNVIGKEYANSVTEISNQFRVTKGAVSQVVNKLFEKGLLTKERSKGYGNEIRLSLTDKGLKAYKIQDDMHKRIEKDFFEHLGDLEQEKIDSFYEIMDEVEDLIDNFLKYESQ